MSNAYTYVRIVLCLWLAARGTAAAQPLEQGLAPLVDETLAANLEVAAADSAVAQRVADLDAARALFRPVLDLTSRVSRADGGRTIDVPVGDLLNPVYAALNELAGTAFAPVANQRIGLIRREEQDTRLTLTQSIYDPRIAPGVDARRGAYRGAMAARDALRARVIRDAKQAYYAWLAARDEAAVLDNALELARENLRVNERLFANGRITRDLVLRAEADLLALDQQRRGAASAVTLAASYANVLRRAPLDAPLPAAAIDADSPARFRARWIAALDGIALAAEPLAALAIERRAELDELEAAVDASRADEAAARAARKPSVAFALDAGSQGEHYALGEDERYAIASIVVRFNAFDGGADRARLRSASAATDALTARRGQAELAIRLEVQRALEELGVADASLDAAARRVAAADAAFAITSRKRDLGQINQTEFIDARNASTDAQLNLQRTRAAALARLADLEFAVGITDPL